MSTEIKFTELHQPLLINIIKLAYHEGGMVYGGFVRNVLAPLLESGTTSTSSTATSASMVFKSVKFWFTTRKNFDNFNAALRTTFPDLTIATKNDSDGKIFRLEYNYFFATKTEGQNLLGKFYNENDIRNTPKPNSKMYISLPLGIFSVLIMEKFPNNIMYEDYLTYPSISTVFPSNLPEGKRTISLAAALIPNEVDANTCGVTEKFDLPFVIKQVLSKKCNVRAAYITNLLATPATPTAITPYASAVTIELFQTNTMKNYLNKNWTVILPDNSILTREILLDEKVLRIKLEQSIKLIMRRTNSFTNPDTPSNYANRGISYVESSLVLSSMPQGQPAQTPPGQPPPVGSLNRMNSSNNNRITPSPFTNDKANSSNAPVTYVNGPHSTPSVPAALSVSAPFTALGGSTTPPISKFNGQPYKNFPANKQKALEDFDKAMLNMQQAMFDMRTAFIKLHNDE